MEPSKGERTRQAILDAAEGLILAQGYHATSMRQIATEAGIAVGGIYNHFENKAAIFAALLERHQPYSHIAARLSELPDDATVEATVEQAARIVTRALLQDPVFIPLVMIDIQEFHGDTLAHLVNEVAPAFLAFMQRLVATGRIRQDIPPAILVRTFASLVVFYALSEIVLAQQDLALFNWPSRQEMDWVGGMVDIFLHGVLR